MLVWLMMLWFAMQLKSPTWVYVVIGMMLVLEFVTYILNVAKNYAEKRMEREQKKLEELKQRVGSNRE